VLQDTQVVLAGIIIIISYPTWTDSHKHEGFSVLRDRLYVQLFDTPSLHVFKTGQDKRDPADLKYVVQS